MKHLIPQILEHEYFTSEATATGPASKKLEKLYVGRSYLLWNEADILLWLESMADTVLDRVDAGDPYADGCRMQRSVRQNCRLPLSMLRHIILSEIEGVTVNNRTIYSFDPLPPKDSINIYA